ncbi:MAG TPA: hypothetical protein VMF69_07570 [Gemmataceae bacterium]|nr:hypothetical protein [Gemmataceae bacterium]
MRCLVACCLSLSLLIAASGCRCCDRVESELRARENDVRELREELDRCGVYNQTLQQEVHALRGQLGMPLSGPPPAAYPVQVLQLGRQTGGRSNDVCPGDDALQVQVEPRDPDGHVIKAPGQLLILAEEITPEGLKRPLSSWMVPPALLRKAWVNGLLTTGYLLNLPWKNWPSTEKLRVTVQFQLADGRVFGADRDVTIRLTPLNQRPGAVPKSNPTPPPVGDGGPPLLPTPRPIDPPTKPNPPPPDDAVPGPFLGAANITPEPSAAEILRPVPLK